MPSRASACAGLAVRAVEEPRRAGWEAVQGPGHLAAESSLGPGAGSAALPSAVRTAAWMHGAWRGGQRGAACQGAAVAACASWLHSAPEAQWRGRTAAGFASVLPAEQPGGQEAFLLQNRKTAHRHTLSSEIVYQSERTHPMLVTVIRINLSSLLSFTLIHTHACTHARTDSLTGGKFRIQIRSPLKL